MISKRTKMTMGELRKLVENSLYNEADEPAQDPAPFQPETGETENGDSLDVQVDRFLNEYEEEARNSKTEGLNFHEMTHRLIREAGEDEEEVDAKPEAEEAPSDDFDMDADSNAMNDSPGLDAFDVEAFANSVARLIDNAETLLEFRNTIMRRAVNMLVKSYDSSVKEAFEDAMQEQHGIAIEKSQMDIDDEYEVPAADKAGASLSSGGGPTGGV